MPIGNKNQVIQGAGTHHIAVQTRDWDESLRFYRDLLGMTPVVEFGSPERKIMLLDVGDGSHIEIFQPKGDTPAPGSAAANDPVIHFALTTTDLPAALERVRADGCT
ncbi:MAG: VOC family protein, partial [Anaerolineae bacterium]|nr:VOC family protein [Anaerolineae bacterium]